MSPENPTRVIQHKEKESMLGKSRDFLIFEKPKIEKQTKEVFDPKNYEQMDFLAMTKEEMKELFRNISDPDERRMLKDYMIERGTLALAERSFKDEVKEGEIKEAPSLEDLSAEEKAKINFSGSGEEAAAEVVSIDTPDSAGEKPARD